MSGRPDLARRLAAEGLGTYQFLRDAGDTIPAAAPAALIEHEEAVQ